MPQVPVPNRRYLAFTSFNLSRARSQSAQEIWEKRRPHTSVLDNPAFRKFGIFMVSVRASSAQLLDAGLAKTEAGYLMRKTPHSLHDSLAGSTRTVERITEP